MPDGFIFVTAPNGTRIPVEISQVSRVRRVLYNESKGASCRIDAGQTHFARETPQDVVAALQPSLPTLIRLTGRDGTPIWLNAHKVTGPVSPLPSEIQDGFHSALYLGPDRIRFREEVEEVRDRMRAVGVEPLPSEEADAFHIS